MLTLVGELVGRRRTVSWTFVASCPSDSNRAHWNCTFAQHGHEHEITNVGVQKFLSVETDAIRMQCI